MDSVQKELDDEETAVEADQVKAESDQTLKKLVAFVNVLSHVPEGREGRMI